jgi:hypothetical protein
MVQQADTMILVPGHGICRWPKTPCAPGAWVGIYPRQEILLYLHCLAGVGMAIANPHSILIFSGGATRHAAGEITEAESYYRIAQAACWWGTPGVENRAFKENHARDSLGNLALSLALFRYSQGHFPRRIIVAGFEFKRERFYLHARALRWQGEFRYVGVNDPPQDGSLQRARCGEAKKRASLQTDPYLKDPVWQAQRRERNPFDHAYPGYSEIPELQRFLNFLYNDSSSYIPDWHGQLGEVDHDLTIA